MGAMGEMATDETDVTDSDNPQSAIRNPQL